MSSTPSYDRIIVDRKDMKLTGFTFESANDSKYQEAYEYQVDPKNMKQTLYNVWTYRSLGMRKYIRQQAHTWGIETLVKIIKAEQKLQEELLKKPLI